MFAAFRNQARRFASTAASAGAHDEHKATMELWKKISYGMIAVALPVYSVYTIWAHSRHHHDPTPVPHFEYLDVHLKNSEHHKQFPWAAKELTMFPTPRVYKE
ncbi:mitochondrial Complex IV (CIV) cytochrome c:O2 oxidoreductase subunit 6a (Cox6a/Cox13) [Andalucia godoyi]|uniref:Mitochondrial Complex IV (CIV) cytochrome c:O2 oxidoreductase subunit 6a (Cox6a/Cox13) n=1 Tax=Andalucia godoyi TaxID=505711 RepID=A0A8K0AHC1_ANDGO|nr:mitochondrial Complex IV (CIV) cytochrome c:O2 oxidoreductase subunit 6a (Cox6a/Cox13) [Andalucia godoyi]|eukprot:ANDGO_07744.mRNA.1 mitochondrial Complex IV (CIV) cytochrome c:O2 oxidoreductase subunit 6a (Cox6a/Cox13)